MIIIKYYICPDCGNLATSEQLEEECSNGGSGSCYCQYMQMQWDTKTKGFEPVYFRVYPEWTEIPASIYSDLLKEKSTTRRLWMFNSIPKLDRNV